MSPKTPRNVSGRDLIKLFGKYGYEVVRQKGSHIRLSKSTNEGIILQYQITIP
ncbi:MAG: type II toxin-antitoxin system HicA family toxin [Mucilaginibacter sp.]